MHFCPHLLGALKVARLVDRRLALGTPHFQDQHRLVRPGTRLQKCTIRLGIDEDIVEHRHVFHAGDPRRIAHV